MSDDSCLHAFAGGLYADMADQYAFAAEERAIDHSHYLLWVEDTLRIIAEEDAKK